MTEWEKTTRLAMAAFLEAFPDGEPRIVGELETAMRIGVGATKSALADAMMSAEIFVQAMVKTFGRLALDPKLFVRHELALEAACHAYLACARAARGEPPS